MKVDCQNETCFFENVFLDHCLVYVPNNNPNCSIPCQRNYCDHEILSDMMCPQWFCQKSSTTTSTTTTTTTWTSTTDTTSVTPHSSTGTMVSYGLNGIFFSILICALAFFVARLIKKKLIARRFEQVRNQALPSVHFSITSSPLNSSSEDSYCTGVSNQNAPENRNLIKKPSHPNRNLIKKNREVRTRARINFQTELQSFMDENFDESGEPVTPQGAEFLKPPEEVAVLPMNLIRNPRKSPQKYGEVYVND